MAKKGLGTSIFYFIIICLHWSADLVSWTQLFRDQDEKMPTGYDKKRGTAKSKKKWNVDSIALSLTNTAVKYGTVYSHPFFSNLLSFWYYTWIFFL